MTSSHKFSIFASSAAALEHQTHVVRHDRYQVNHVLEVGDEGPLRGAGGQADEELDGEPGRAEGLADEERVHVPAATELGERRHRLHAEHRDGGQCHRYRDHRHERVLDPSLQQIEYIMKNIEES